MAEPIQKQKEQSANGSSRRSEYARHHRVTSEGRVEVTVGTLLESPAIKRIADLAQEIVRLSAEKRAG